MIKFKDTILKDFFIDPITAIITNSKGEIQEINIHKDGRPYFKNMSIHQIQIHTHYGWKQGFDIHHIDENKMNNALSNLVYLTRSEHAIIHSNGNKNMLGKHHTEETKRKMSEVRKGENNGMFKQHHTEDAKLKIR